MLAPAALPSRTPTASPVGAPAGNVVNASGVPTASPNAGGGSARRRARRESGATDSWGDRRLQEDARQSGQFLVLSHPRDSMVLYDFDSRSAPSIRQHRFAIAAIARRPRGGNYRGSAGNGNEAMTSCCGGASPTLPGDSRARRCFSSGPRATRWRGRGGRCWVGRLGTGVGGVGDDNDGAGAVGGG